MADPQPLMATEPTSGSTETRKAEVDTALIRVGSWARYATAWPTVRELCDALDEARADNEHWRTTANVATNNVADWIAANEKAEADLTAARAAIARVEALAADDFGEMDDGEGGTDRYGRLLYPRDVRAALTPPAGGSR